MIFQLWWNKSLYCFMFSSQSILGILHHSIQICLLCQQCSLNVWVNLARDSHEEFSIHVEMVFKLTSILETFYLTVRDGVHCCKLAGALFDIACEYLNMYEDVKQKFYNTYVL